MNEFDGSDLITEIWESLGQIGVWQIGRDEILREFGSEKYFVEGEERKRELEIERAKMGN